MPFPLAHPAAVLPLRRFCPQRLDFPALVIGSLVPDIGYAFSPYHVAEFSHRFIIGAFGFCLPVGCLIWVVFYFLRRPAVCLLPNRYRQALLPLCQRPSGMPWKVAASVLIGTWTHQFLDSIAHGNGWIVQHLTFPQQTISWGNHWLYIYDGIYYACTFLGAGWLALAYLNWLKNILAPSKLSAPGVKYGCAILLAASTLVIASVSRGEYPLGIILAGAVTTLLLFGFLSLTGILFSKSSA